MALIVNECFELFQKGYAGIKCSCYAKRTNVVFFIIVVFGDVRLEFKAPQCTVTPLDLVLHWPTELKGWQGMMG